MRIKAGAIFVSAPFWISKKVIDDFIASKKDWIHKALSKQAPNASKKTYTEGELHLFFGEQKVLRVILSDNVIRTSLQQEEDKLILKIYKNHSGSDYLAQAERAFISFYLEQLILYLTDRVNYYCQQLGVEYSKIEVKKVSSIWGSCSAKNVLSFNRKLCLAPKQIVDYVVIHEVCHLRERNHSSRFWGLVRNYDKNYKQNRRWLHQNHQLLNI